MKTIKLTFLKSGDVLKEVDGFQGTGCLDATDFIDKAIGTIEKTELKDSYHLPNPVVEDQGVKISI